MQCTDNPADWVRQQGLKRLLLKSFVFAGVNFCELFAFCLNLNDYIQSIVRMHKAGANRRWKDCKIDV